MRNLNVLVVEDDPPTLELMQELFTLHRVSVQTISDGEQAARMIGPKKYDAVFTDLLMPKVDGFELIRQIRRSSWNPHTPIVILSGQGDTKTRAEAFQAGGTFFLEKPLDRTSLTRLLKSTRGTMVEERRRSKRIPFCREVACTAGDIKISGRSLNLSLDGILFQGNGSLKRGRVVQLSFRLEEEKPPIRARGVVVRADDARRVGVRLVPLQSEDRQRIHDFIAKEVDTL